MQHIFHNPLCNFYYLMQIAELYIIIFFSWLYNFNLKLNYINFLQQLLFILPLVMARQTPAAVREDTNESQVPERINSNLVQDNQVIFIIHFYFKFFFYFIN